VHIIIHICIAVAAGAILIIIEEPILLWSSSAKTSPFDIHNNII